MLSRRLPENRRPRRARSVATTCVLAAALLAVAAVDLFGASPCARRRVPLQGILAVSAAAAPDGDLLIIDFVAEQLLKVELPDLTWGAVSGVAGEALQRRRLEAIRPFDGGLLVRQSSPRHFFELDPHLGIKPGPAYDVIEKPQQRGSRVKSVWLFEPAGRSLVTCSDVYLGSGDPEAKANWVTGVVRIPLDDPPAFEILHQFDVDDRSALGCRLTLPLIANLGDRTFFLALDDAPRIYELRPGEKPRPLGAFPEKYAISPTLPTDPARSELTFVYGLLEQATMPAGLFAWEGSLYLLSRSPADWGTDWRLTRIDPDGDALAGTVRLGTRANHLMVVPGDPYWALIEKGPVESGFRDQDITGIIAVPAGEIRSWRPESVLCELTEP